jgi:hypothetical protein
MNCSITLQFNKRG